MEILATKSFLKNYWEFSKNSKSKKYQLSELSANPLGYLVINSVLKSYFSTFSTYFQYQGYRRQIILRMRTVLVRIFVRIPSTASWYRDGAIHLLRVRTYRMQSESGTDTRTGQYKSSSTYHTEYNRPCSVLCVCARCR